MQLAEQVQDFGSRVAVEVAGRLVGQDQRGLVDQRAGDGHALLLAAGEFGRLVVQPVAQAEPLEGGAGPRRRVRAGEPWYKQRHLDVLDHRGTRQQVVRLEDETEVRLRSRASSSSSMSATGVPAS